MGIDILGNSGGIGGWVGENCKFLQPALDSAEAAIKLGNVAVGTEWKCTNPNCEVKIRVRRKRPEAGGLGLKLVNAENCPQIPSLDEKLP